MRFKITVAYVGTRYHGWQRQADEVTVQGTLEDAARAIAGSPCPIHGAGRTDAGVHARGQVAHLDGPASLDSDAWCRALNAKLPPDIRVLDGETVGETFHARHDARAKRYRYSLETRPVASPFRAPFAWHIGRALDLEAMRAAADCLFGELDQRIFATQPAGAERPRPLSGFEIIDGNVVEIAFSGRSFLRYAVRGMTGTLVQVGRGQRTVESFARLVESGTRADAGPAAPAHGLCLEAVTYDC